MRIGGAVGSISIYGAVMDRDNLNTETRLCGRVAETAHKSVCLPLAVTGSRQQVRAALRMPNT